MGPKKATSGKRKAHPVERVGDEVGKKRTKKMSIGEGDERQLLDGCNEVVPSPTAQREEEEDEVVSEVGIYLLPLTSTNPCGTSITQSANLTGGATPSSVCINRLQFPQQHPNMLRRRFGRPRHRYGKEQEEEGDDDDEHWGTDRRERKKYFAHYKAQVKHLRLGIGSDAEEEVIAPSVPPFTGGGGIAELLTKRNHTSSSSSLFPPPSSAAPSSTKHKPPSSKEVFTGEGFSKHGLLNYAVGFFKEGHLFLLPVDKTYEMRKPLRGTIERESAARATALKASSSTSSASSLRSAAGDSVFSGTASASSSATTVTAPLRIRFARAENDMQRRRREQSSFYKQKLVEQDQWIPLKVEHRNLTELYEKDISKVLLSSECSSK